ncbi:MAG: DUF1016 domain-containing protein [Chloroflexi bacterium]|nr:DUF1016 domain-containing protein [Chloroflexota bacterium]
MSIDKLDSYVEFLKAVKERVRQGQYAALKAVNKELITLHWDLGRLIVETQQKYGWGESVIEHLAKDLKLEFEGERGFAVRNLRYIRSFYLTYCDDEKLQSLIAEIGWTHHLKILGCKDSKEREFYLRMTKIYAWSVRALEQQIVNKAYERWLLNQTNFEGTLPEDKRARAVLAVKDDYNFDFLGIEGEPSERELEDGLVANITKLLAEMGGYFTFAGKQFRIEVDEKEYFVDLLFYHRQLKCLVAIDLKTGEFKPEYAGKMQFYLSALDDQSRVEGENPSIGLIVCRKKDRTTVEYTLRDVNRPMGVATYHNYAGIKELPDKIAKYLPSEEEIEKRLTQLPDEQERGGQSGQKG